MRKKYYIGMASRKIEYRKKEHEIDTKCNRKTTTLEILHEDVFQINLNENKFIPPPRINIIDLL